MHYSYIRIDIGRNEYIMSLGTFTGEGTDWFNRYQQNGRWFSTPDNDNYYRNCAASSKSGWWYYTNCFNNINKKPPQVGDFDVLFTEMKIRPKDCINQ